MEEWRDTGAAQGGVTHQAACESQSFKAEMGLTKLFEVKGHRDTRLCVGVEQPGPTCGRGEGETPGRDELLFKRGQRAALGFAHVRQKVQSKRFQVFVRLLPL